MLALVLALGPDAVFARLAVFFSQMAVVTFGGAYAVLAYVAQQAVEELWLAGARRDARRTRARRDDARAADPRRRVRGFLAAFRAPGGLDPWLAAVLGAALMAWVTFLPCFFWIFLGAALCRAAAGDPGLAACARPGSGGRWSA